VNRERDVEQSTERNCFGDVPPLGLGTFRMTDFRECESAVRTALEIGYRHIDGAEAYQNEESLGEAIRNSDVPRDDLFVTTKILHPSLTERYDENGIVDAALTSMNRLGVESVDLFYGVHWPGGQHPVYDVDSLVSACERLYEAGKFDYFGLSNMTPELIEEIRAATDLTVDAIQCEMHPLLPQKPLRSYAQSRGIDFVAYAPLTGGRALKIPQVQYVAEKKDLSEAQVCLAWALHKGVTPIPKSCSPDHLIENWEAQMVKLDPEDIRRIDGISKRKRIYDPNYAPDWNPVRLRE